MEKGLVIKSTGSWYTVESKSGKIFDCKIKGNFRIKGIKSTNPVAVGDFVDFKTLPNSSETDAQNIGLITAISERKNYIARRSPNLSKQSHIIAANIDQAILIATINYPITTTTFIDRYLASAEAYRIPVLLVFNKTDRYDDKQTAELKEYIRIYKNIGYKCLATSAENRVGIEELKQAIANKTNVINGHSGVGKSTLINLIQPDLNIKTKQISDVHKTGKHTTTYSTLYKLDSGGYIIDTPGIKGFGMLDMEAWEISHYFPEIFKLSEKCQYNNCSHTHEPGCAVKQAVEKGEVAPSRFISYLGLLESDDKYRPAF
ncbi:ribosome small subunit-dependent GTPase A [Maribellus comscasis]|uniref:Small ribosomal subunit biogenesis GTPase RsgA n=1 Tax=Maribellus comscasis TaxID=2681766 RepID=A0A6I6JP52_9BACT|nr:ribosome small subunit-dependent GTPase A [Maribellus comscasis]QGY44241.1 ribosome small subunit-dependent GTPase A [Maribellus comscasis]